METFEKLMNYNKENSGMANGRTQSREWCKFTPFVSRIQVPTKCQHSLRVRHSLVTPVVRIRHTRSECFHPLHGGVDLHSTWKMSTWKWASAHALAYAGYHKSTSLPCHINTAPNAMHSRPTCLRDGLCLFTLRSSLFQISFVSSSWRATYAVVDGIWLPLRAAGPIALTSCLFAWI